MVGTWVDGSTIYQKTVSCGALPNQETKTIAHNISNLDRVISIIACSKNPTSKGQIPLPYVQNRTDDNIMDSVFVNASYIVLVSGTDRSTVTETYVTIQYTKTSD